MIRTHKKQLIISSIIILLPILAGLLLWNRLPDTVPTHWGFSGEADGWSSKGFAVFVPPVIMLALHWFCHLITALDPNTKKQSPKVFGMILWICPVLSLSVSTMTYALALNYQFNPVSVMFPGMGITFILIGNYLPKCKQNHTIGIKVRWALANEENWNATHRFSGKVWVIGGIALVALTFLPAEIAILPMFLITLLLALIPVIYSWQYDKKQNNNGTVYEVHPSAMDKTSRMITRGALIFAAVILIITAIILFTGEINYIYADDSFTVTASYWNDLTVAYSEITAIELRSGNISGTRTWGLGNFRILAGTFHNDEFGSHTRYTCYKPEACVVVTCGEKTLVLSGRNAASTQLIYDELTQRVK